MLDQPGIHDALVEYIGPKHNLHLVSASLFKIYGSPFYRTQHCHKSYEGFVVFPAHMSTIRNKVTSLIEQECFGIDISCFDCFEQIVYTEESRSRSADIFTTLKAFILPCVERIYIDCHWLGYIVTTPTADGNWILNPMYEKCDLRRNTQFDFEAYGEELDLYLTSWPNLKEVHLFKPFRDHLFLKCLYAHTKRIVDGFKTRLVNPHHLSIVEKKCNGGVIESIEESLLFLRNVDTRFCHRRERLM